MLFRGMWFGINLGFFVEDLPIFAVLRHVLEIGNVVLDLGLRMDDIVRLLNFNRFFDTPVLHASFVLILGKHLVLIVCLIRRARRSFFMILVKHNKVVSHYRSAISYLQRHVFYRLLESVG
jgi:hypothetical protein